MEEEAGPEDAIEKEEISKHKGDENLRVSENVHIADIPESSKTKAEQDISSGGAHESENDTAINVEFSSKLIGRTNLSDQTGRLETNSSSSDANGLHVTTSEPQATELSETFPLMKLESSAENNCVTGFPEKISPPFNSTPTDNRIFFDQGKGKEKALTDGDIHGQSSSDKDNSDESCNGVGLFLKGIKRESCIHQETHVGSKRMKNQFQGSLSSTSIVRHDSSFGNWISNMVKCLTESNKTESSSLALPLSYSNTLYRKNRGENFPNLFRTLYSRDTMMSETWAEKETYAIQESKEPTVAEKTSLENVPMLCGVENDNSFKQIVVSKEEVNPHISNSVASQRNETYSADFDCNPYAYESERMENIASGTVVCDKRKVWLSPSDFSCKKQVNSTKDNMPGKTMTHGLWITRYCTGAARLENSNPIIEEVHGCSVENRGVEEDHRLVAPGHMGCSSTRSLFDSLPTYVSWKVNESSTKILSTSYEFEKAELFHATRKLRLSRADVFRWMNCDVSSVHINGFLLRLRIRKMRRGHRGTGYYVACITGDTREQISCKSKESIVVDVGGAKSTVGLQYVSNHDFLEDEITAWWCSIMNSGGRIPSLDELNLKLEDRKYLGF